MTYWVDCDILGYCDILRSYTMVNLITSIFSHRKCWDFLELVRKVAGN